MTARLTDLSHEQIDGLISRLEAAITAGSPLPADDVALVLDIIRSYFHIQERLHRNDLTLHKLKKLIGIVSGAESTKSLLNHDTTQQNEAEVDDKGATSGDSSSRKRNHGKKPASEFPGALTAYHPIDRQSGSSCPDCGQGRLYKYQPSQFVRISGQAPLQATVHVSEQLRCNGCQKLYRADLPAEVLADGSPGERFGYSAKAIVALLKYGSGSPFYRQQQLQGLLGVPVTASTLWDLVEDVANAARPVAILLRQLAADAQIFYADDTGNKILSAKPEMKIRRGGKKEQLRTGVHTSAVLAILQDGRQIVLYKTGINHVGEFIDEVLTARKGTETPFIYMSDALSGNRPTKGRAILASCNVHARRQFADIVEQFPDEVSRVLETFHKVYAIEADVIETGASPEARQLRHEKDSLPLMEDLFSWMAEKLHRREVEPNSNLGRAINYSLSRRDALLAFTYYPGCPLDNNQVEQRLKLVVLHRKNSLFFKHQTGAWVSDILMTLIATAGGAGINVFDYLTTLQRRSAEVRAGPEKFLPWNFRNSSDQ